MARGGALCTLALPAGSSLSDWLVVPSMMFKGLGMGRGFIAQWSEAGIPMTPSGGTSGAHRESQQNRAHAGESGRSPRGWFGDGLLKE